MENLQDLLERHKELFNISVKFSDASVEDLSIRGETLKALVPELLKTFEFKNTKEIIVTDQPYVDKPGFEGKKVVPSVKNNPEGPEFDLLYEGETERPINMPVYIVKEGQFFAEKVSLYEIRLSPKTYDVKQIEWEDGVWTYPIVATSKSFVAKKKIAIVFSPEKMQDLKIGVDLEDPISTDDMASDQKIEAYKQKCVEKEKTIKENILQQVKDVLDGKIVGSNIPSMRNVFVRATQESLPPTVDSNKEYKKLIVTKI